MSSEIFSNEKLVEEAYKAMENSYSPYSKFKVGAALLTNENKLYTGCNIENASYGATICAERTAIFKAVSEGVKSFDKIAIVCNEHRNAIPCGICLQVMAEFMPEAKVVLDEKGVISTYRISELLPQAFVLK